MLVSVVVVVVVVERGRRRRRRWRWTCRRGRNERELPELGQERRWTLAREEADLRGNKLKWNAVIIMRELGCCEAQGGSEGGLTRRLARGSSQVCSVKPEYGFN